MFKANQIIPSIITFSHSILPGGNDDDYVDIGI